ncbi:MAG: type II secretion system F family protein [Rhodospirillales bacterium]|nr:type II secretion system F family protein [Alphaproteobacteria bacterium]MCB9986882.1 type II secretion system F family protein [Rhodospirillales bacterium]USO08340.1 MAG: type II secretion system F family protein [Rhodospirillales bacterium]
MQQWLAEVAYETRSGTKRVTEAYFLPTLADVRREITKKGAFPLSIRPYQRSPMERMLARSSWWQVQLLRGIQFRAGMTSPGVALWKMISAETNPRRQNILAPAREALSQGLGVMDALKSLNIFEHNTLAILAASEKANKLSEGIPYAIESITQKRRNSAKIKGTMAWLGFDVFSILQGMIWGKDMVLGYFHGHAPKDPSKLEEFNRVVHNLELTWNALIVIAIGMAAFMIWCLLSFWYNRGKTDFPTARIVRKIPLIGAYMRDLGFADSMSAGARMIRGNVPIGETFKQASQATSMPDVTQYWLTCYEELQRGVSLGIALDREPLSRGERLELATLSDLAQVATIMESIAEMRTEAAKTKHSLIVWLAFGLTALYLLLAFGSAIFALTVMNMSMDSMVSDLMGT